MDFNSTFRFENKFYRRIIKKKYKREENYKSFLDASHKEIGSLNVPPIDPIKVKRTGTFEWIH